MKLCISLHIFLALPFFGTGIKTDFSSPVATAEFSKFAGILSVAFSQHHLSNDFKRQNFKDKF